MKNAMKKLLSLMLVAILLVSAVPFQASAATGGESEGYYAIPVQMYVNDVHKGTGSLTVYADGTQELNETVALNLLASNGLVTSGYEYTLNTWTSTTGWSGKEGSTSYAWIASDECTDKAAYELAVYVTETIPVVYCDVCGNVEHEGDCCSKCKATGHVADDHCAVCDKYDGTHTTSCTKYTCDDCGQLINAGGSHTTACKYYESSNANNGYVDADTAKVLKVVLDLNYTGSQDYYLYLENTNIKWADAFDQIEDQFGTFTRDNYTFAGWYWDDDYDYPCKNNEYVAVSSDAKITVYAKWTRNEAAPKTILYLYTNGKTSSAAKLIDVSAYTDSDNKLSLAEALTAARKYYTFSGYDGLYDAALWNNGAYNNLEACTYVAVNGDGGIALASVDDIQKDTIAYLMVWNASTVSSSSSTTTTTTSKADSSNPTTGDQIFVAVTVMAVSAAALVGVYFYMKKRRAV